MRITARTRRGGKVFFNQKDGAWACYCMDRVGPLPVPDLLRAGATLADGRQVKFFLNRTTGLVVVEVVETDGRHGFDVVRKRILSGPFRGQVV